jgi:hypothetical protein
MLEATKKINRALYIPHWRKIFRLLKDISYTSKMLFIALGGSLLQFSFYNWQIMLIANCLVVWANLTINLSKRRAVEEADLNLYVLPSL